MIECNQLFRKHKCQKQLSQEKLTNTLLLLVKKP
jgi:hypothetical protein